jgi:hypothetical protein
LKEEAYMKARRAIITGPFPTVEDTARILGVSDTHLKELLRLTRSGRSAGLKKNGVALEKSGSKVSRTKSKTSANKRRASAPRKRRARGKSAKALA